MVNGDISQEFVKGIEDRYKMVDLCQDQLATMTLAVMFVLEHEMSIALH